MSGALVPQHLEVSNLSLADALRLRLEPTSSPAIASDQHFNGVGSIGSRRQSSEPKAPKRRRYFFFLRFVVLRAVFFAADFVFVFAFFAMLPS
jgi:hypothetical protein